MAAQHLPQDLARSNNGLKELAHTMKKNLRYRAGLFSLFLLIAHSARKDIGGDTNL